MLANNIASRDPFRPITIIIGSFKNYCSFQFLICIDFNKLIRLCPCNLLLNNIIFFIPDLNVVYFTK